MTLPSLGRFFALWGDILAVAASCAGCASAPVPDTQLAVSRSAINDALSAGAAESAPQDLQNARDKLAQADAAVASNQHENARMLAEEAEVDARLATAKARTARANLAAAEVQKSIRTLRENLATPPVNPPATGGTP